MDPQPSGDIPLRPPELPTSSIKTYTFEQLKANAALLASIDAASDQTFKQAYGESDMSINYRDLLSDGDGVVMVAQEGDAVIGAGMVRYHEAKSYGEGSQTSQELSHMFVKPEHQKKAMAQQSLERE